MKTLEQRAKELQAQRLAKEAALRQQEDQEGMLANALSSDIEKYAAESSISILPTQVNGSQIVITNGRGAQAYIKVVSDGEGPDWFTFSSETIKLNRCNEDNVLEAILKWLQH
jgi:hypothetical protein